MIRKVKLYTHQYVIVEVKGDHRYEEPIILAKAAKEYASMSDIDAV